MYSKTKSELYSSSLMGDLLSLWSILSWSKVDLVYCVMNFITFNVG